MIRSFDLAMEGTLLEEFLNNPLVALISIRVGCSDGGFTTAIAQFNEVRFPIERKRHRKFERFALFDGSDEDLDKIMRNPANRILNRYEFVTESGVIIVLDYETKKGRS